MHACEAGNRVAAGWSPAGRSRPVLSVLLPWRFGDGSGGGAVALLCRVRRRPGPGPRIKSVPRSVDARGIGGAAASELKGGGVIAHRPARGIARSRCRRRASELCPNRMVKMRQSQRAEQLATEVRISDAAGPMAQAFCSKTKTVT